MSNPGQGESVSPTGAPSDVQATVHAIHSSSTMAVVATAGAGAAAFRWLLGEPGSSRTVLEALAPNSTAAMIEFVGRKPEQFVSKDTALLMAEAAFRRALRLRGTGAAPVVGAGCTAAVATDRARRGEHRCHVAVWSETGSSVVSLQFEKGRRSRLEEDDLVSRLLLARLAAACDVDAGVAVPLATGERVVDDARSYGDALAAVVAGHLRTAVYRTDGTVEAGEPDARAILAGSFNPLHDGHVSLADTAAKLLGAKAAFELSVTNVDKSALDEHEVRRRLAQFHGLGDVAITRVPTFLQKARLMPGRTFVIGADTALRLVDAAYYDDDESTMLDALAEMRLLKCRFLVAGRMVAGRFVTLGDVPAPDGFRDILDPIPESVFRDDVSSSRLRQTAGSM